MVGTIDNNRSIPEATFIRAIQDLDLFWEKVKICIEDLVEEDTNGNLVNKLINTIEVLDDWLDLLQKEFNDNNIERILNNLYAANKLDFYDLYCCIIFGEKVNNLNVIIEQTQKYLDPTQYPTEDVNVRPYVYALFKQDESIINDIYYEDIIQSNSSSLKPYYTSVAIDAHSDKEINIKLIKRLFTQFEGLKRKQNRRRNKVWWVDADDDIIKIVFRRQKTKRSAIEIVDGNKFLKTAEERIIIFSNNFQKVEIHTKSEPLRTKKIAEYIAKSILGIEDIEYIENPITIENNAMGNFISNIYSESTEIFGIKIHNTPIANSPTLEFTSLNGLPLNQSIIELREHSVDLLDDQTNVQYIKVKINDKLSTINFVHNDNNVVVICKNKRITEDDRQSIMALFQE